MLFKKNQGTLIPMELLSSSSSLFTCKKLIVHSFTVNQIQIGGVSAFETPASTENENCRHTLLAHLIVFQNYVFDT